MVGAGLMAGQLALLFARRLEVPVVLTDLDQERVDRGRAYVHGEIDKLLAKGRLGPDAANRLRRLVTGSLTGRVRRRRPRDRGGVRGAGGQAGGVRRAGGRRLARVRAGHQHLLAVGHRDGRGLAHPERVVGLHFFNPVAVLPLLEVVRGEDTDDATLATAFAVGKTLKKSCVLVRTRRPSWSTGC